MVHCLGCCPWILAMGPSLGGHFSWKVSVSTSLPLCLSLSVFLSLCLSLALSLSFCCVFFFSELSRGWNYIAFLLFPFLPSPGGLSSLSPLGWLQREGSHALGVPHLCCVSLSKLPCFSEPVSSFVICG